MGLPSRVLAGRAQDNPQFINVVVAASGGQLFSVPGDVLIPTKDDELIGTVGVSGDTSDNDEICTIAGIEAARMVAQIE